MKFKIISGLIQSAPIKTCIYGVEGIGKSTLAADFPDPLFIDTEGSTSRMNVKRFEKPENWQALMDMVAYIRDNPTLCKTLVIDTIDWAEELCIRYVCNANHQSGIESFGYGKGYTYVGEEMQKLLQLLNEVASQGIHIVLVSHSTIKKFEQPEEAGAYDRYELKTTKKVAPLIKEWVDLLLFCNYKTTVVKTSDGKTKAQGGKDRVMYTTHNACWDAKNRFGLPDVLPLSYDAIRNIVEAGAENESGSVLDQLSEKMTDAGVTESDLVSVITKNGYYPEGTALKDMSPEFLVNTVLGSWENLISVVNKMHAIKEN